MRHILLLATSLILGFSVHAQSSNDKAPQIRFDKVVHDYDTLTHGTEAVCIFTFKNEGTAPLILSDVASSCGCTIPSFEHSPVLPGHSGEIKVRYNASVAGSFRKTVVVRSNAVGQETFALSIKGYVKRR